MPSGQYAINPGYYSQALGQSAKKKRLLTGRGLTTDEALSGYYADIAARQAELEASSLRKARTKQQDLEQSKFDELKGQFDEELAYKYRALDKEGSIANARTDLMREQLEGQQRGQMIQGILTAPTAIERAYKGASKLYEYGKGAYDSLYGMGPESSGGYSLTEFGAAAPEEYFAMNTTPVAGWSLEAAPTAALDAYGASTAAATADAAAAGIGSGATVAGELGTLGTIGQFGAALPGIGTAMAGTAAAGMAISSGLNWMGDQIFGEGKQLSSYTTQELLDQYNPDHPGSNPIYLELKNRGFNFAGAGLGELSVASQEKYYADTYGDSSLGFGSRQPWMQTDPDKYVWGGKEAYRNQPQQKTATDQIYGSLFGDMWNF